jgi:hypothetical protein
VCVDDLLKPPDPAAEIGPEIERGRRPRATFPGENPNKSVPLYLSKTVPSMTML